MALYRNPVPDLQQATVAIKKLSLAGSIPLMAGWVKSEQKREEQVAERIDIHVNTLITHRSKAGMN